jgi:succinate dehydrogenase / fumarate reductase cytochrome b subunit
VFASPVYSFIYIIAVVIAAIHISHGLWSAFQTIGANHPKYISFIRGVGIGFSIVVAIGFGFIPIFMAIA